MTDNVLTPGASQSLYYDEDEEGQQYMLPGTVYSPDYSAQYDRVPRPIEHVDKSRIAGNGKDGAQFLSKIVLRIACVHVGRSVVSACGHFRCSADRLRLRSN